MEKCLISSIKICYLQKLIFVNFIENCENYIVLTKIIRQPSLRKICQFKVWQKNHNRKILLSKNNVIFSCIFLSYYSCSKFKFSSCAVNIWHILFQFFILIYYTNDSNTFMEMAPIEPIFEVVYLFTLFNVGLQNS